MIVAPRRDSEDVLRSGLRTLITSNVICIKTRLTLVVTKTTSCPQCCSATSFAATASTFEALTTGKYGAHHSGQRCANHIRNRSSTRARQAVRNSQATLRANSLSVDVWRYHVRRTRWLWRRCGCPCFFDVFTVLTLNHFCHLCLCLEASAACASSQLPCVHYFPGFDTHIRSTKVSLAFARRNHYLCGVLCIANMPSWCVCLRLMSS